MPKKVSMDDRTQFTPSGQFAVGNTMSSVRTGRVKALYELDKLLLKTKHLKYLSKALEKLLYDDPIFFFTKIVMPLLPRNHNVQAVVLNANVNSDILEALRGQEIIVTTVTREEGE